MKPTSIERDYWVTRRHIRDAAAVLGMTIPVRYDGSSGELYFEDELVCVAGRTYHMWGDSLVDNVSEEGEEASGLVYAVATLFRRKGIENYDLPRNRPMRTRELDSLYGSVKLLRSDASKLPVLKKRPSYADAGKAVA